MSVSNLERLAFLKSEYARYYRARAVGNIAEAWRHLERAHIVSQPLPGAHMQAHCRMLAFAMRENDWREVTGQLVRLLLAPVGNFAGRLPRGNSGRARVSAFAPMPVPPELERFEEDSQ